MRTNCASFVRSTSSWRAPAQNERAHAAAKRELTRARQSRDGEATFLGRAVDMDATNGNTLSTLSRYEAALERSFYRALHELQRLQAARQGRHVEVPRAVEVDVSGLVPNT